MNDFPGLRTGAFLGALATLLGAFAAHGLKGHLDAAALQTFETGVRYQMYHALAMLLCGALADRRRTAAAAWCFLGGIVLFSGSLYGLSALGLRWLGPVTPFGGVLFLCGWILLALSRRAD
ncbi:MAG: DUF423 domain-containing protein [Planctomycetota bacterium]